jgi:hypothetical protein
MAADAAAQYDAGFLSRWGKATVHIKTSNYTRA